MKFTYSDIAQLRRATLALVLISIIGLLGITLLLGPTGAWYIPAGTLFGIVAVLFWVKSHDERPFATVSARRF